MKFVLQNPLSRKGIVKVSKHWLRKKIVERRFWVLRRQEVGRCNLDRIYGGGTWGNPVEASDDEQGSSERDGGYLEWFGGFLFCFV